jgi:hypothetical protein
MGETAKWRVGEGAQKPGGRRDVSQRCASSAPRMEGTYGTNGTYRRRWIASRRFASVRPGLSLFLKLDEFL